MNHLVTKLAKLFQPDGPAKLRNRLLRAGMRVRRVTPLTVTLREAETLFAPSEEGNRQLAEALKPYLASARCVFDVGANAGLFSRTLLTTNPEFRGRLVLFEPIPNLLSLAVRTLSSFTQIDRVYVNAALGDAAGEVRIFLPPNLNIGWITLRPTSARQGDSVLVQVAAAAEYLRLYLPDLIKIDVEGYEAHILHNILPLLTTSYQPVLLVEVDFSGRGGPDWPLMELCFEGLRKARYGFYRADGARLSDESLNRLVEVADVLIKPTST